MANYPKYDLTGQTPAATYENILQYNIESASLVSGFGNDLPQLNITASLAFSSSYAPTITTGLTSTKSFVANNVTQSIYINNGLIINWIP